MYAGRVACSNLVSHVEYAPMGQTDKRTDRRRTDADRRGKCNNVAK